MLHGLVDEVVPYNQSQLLYDTTTAAGNEARLTLVPGAQHAVAYIMGAEEATTWITNRGEDEKKTVGSGPTWDEIEEFVRANF